MSDLQTIQQIVLPDTDLQQISALRILCGKKFSGSLGVPRGTHLTNVFGIRRNLQSVICSIRGIEHYVDVARSTQVDLTCGYLFRPTTPNGGILDAPFTSTTAEARLKLYLKEMGQDDGETLHGFRSGCSIILALSGVELTKIMDHIGRHTALHYLQLAKVLNPSGASARLASSEVMSVNNTWTNLNELKRFLCAFTAVNSPKRPLSD